MDMEFITMRYFSVMLVLNYKYVILEWLGLYFLNEYFV